MIVWVKGRNGFNSKVIYFCLLCINWTGYAHQIATVDTGSIKEIPDNLVVFKGAHNIKYLRATGTYVDGS